jgi:hypothetical protein
VECGQGAIEVKLVTATDALIQQGAHQGCSGLFEISLLHAAHHKNLVQHENQGSWNPTDNENRLQKRFAFKTFFSRLHSIQMHICKDSKLHRWPRSWPLQHVCFKKHTKSQSVYLQNQRVCWTVFNPATCPSLRGLKCALHRLTM